jgi:hypothetical protein
VDNFLQYESWDNTWAGMVALVRHRLKTKRDRALQISESSKAILPTASFPIAVA